MTLKDQALKYAKAGLKIVPVYPPGPMCGCGDPKCKQAGKHQIVSVDQASYNPAQVELWWTRTPNANIALRTGWPSGIYILDVDKKSGGLESLARLLKQYGPLPKTVEVNSGGGGKHFWFKTTGTLGGRIGFLPGLDFRAERQLCTLPGSIHLSGVEYTWVNSYFDTPLAQLPVWLAVLVRKR